MTEPIEKCEHGFTCKEDCEMGCWIDNSLPIEKITDETALFTRWAGKGDTHYVKDLKEPYRTMLLSSAEKDAKIKQLQYDIEVAIEVHEQQDKDVADKIAKIKELETKIDELTGDRDFHFEAEKYLTEKLKAD